MPSLAASSVSSETRPIPLRMRPDLAVQEQRYEGRVWRTIKEPVGMNYFRFKEEDWFVLSMLDGRNSLDQIQTAYHRRFAPEKITTTELQTFIGSLHKNGLLLANQPGQGREFLARRDERRRQELLATFSNLLAIRFRGIDPERFLAWLHPKTRWIYTRWCFALYLLLAASALVLVTVQFETFRAKLPAFHEFFQAKNAVWLAVALGASKVLHEIGHGLTCKHYGGECHEMGVMILVLTPCLYCNVSDSWMLPNKWHRIAIGAAGMYVEGFLASVATFVWWVTEPGILNYVCLSTMFVCSVNTVLVNGNPLMRYDGYYILADWLEVPNLAQKARGVLMAVLSKHCLGLDTSQQDRLLPERGRALFVLYMVGSTVYRWVVLVGILWFLSRVLKPYNLEVIGRIITLAVLYGLVVVPAWQLWKFFRVPGRVSQVKPVRLAVSVAVVAAVLAAVALIPVPHHVYASLMVEARDAARVYVSVPGTLEQQPGIKPGAKVAAGQTLAVLASPDLALQIEELRGQRDSQRLHVENLKRQRLADPSLATQIPPAQEALEDLEKRLAQRLRDQKRLTLRAPVAGVVLPPPQATTPPIPKDQLRHWSGSPLEEAAQGAWLENETMFCLVGDQAAMEAVLVIDQGDIEFIDRRGGQEVEILLAALPGHTFLGRIAQVSQADLKLAPKQLSVRVGGELQTHLEKSGAERPESTSYQARVPVDDPQGQLVLGYRGRGKIKAQSRTLGQMLYRYLSQTLRFRL